MKIIQLIPILGTGGAEKFTIDLSNELASLGHDVILVTLFDKNETSILEPYVNTNRVKRVSLKKKIGFDIKCFLRVLKLIIKEKPDIVHGHVGAIKYMALASILYRKCQYFATIHSEAKREAGSGVELIVRQFLFHYRLVVPVTISDESQASFKDFYGINASMIYNGCSPYNTIPEDMSKYREGVEYLFVHAGRLQSVKNQILLIKAFTKLLDDGVKARLLIMGRKEDPKVYDSISTYFCDLIQYIGEQKDCRSYMSVSDAFCLSSIMEGMPISVVEALSVGCVPIVTPVGGCVNVVKNGFNGLIAMDVSVESYYNAIKTFIGLNADDKVYLKENAIKTYNNLFSIHSCTNKYVELYKKFEK